MIEFKLMSNIERLVEKDFKIIDLLFRLIISGLFILLCCFFLCVYIVFDLCMD